MRQQLREAIDPEAGIELQLDQLLHAAINRVVPDAAQAEHVVPATVLLTAQKYLARA